MNCFPFLIEDDLYLLLLVRVGVRNSLVLVAHGAL